ncbi:MAG: 2-oxo acid dehydrogenase subunit E2, partial [Rhodospirillales bacterium]
MVTEVKVPALGESVTEATVAKWMKAVGEAVAADEPLVELETDKVTLEINAPAAGVLSDIAAPEGSEVEVGALLGVIGDGAAKAKTAAAEPVEVAEPAPPAAPAAPVGRQAVKPLSPAVRKLLAEHNLDAADVAGTGKDGRLTKSDVLACLDKGGAKAPTAAPAPAPAAAQYPPRPPGRREEKVRMTRLRRMIAARLKEAQNTAAMLTTFNQADMSEVMALRARYRDIFEKKHGVRVGFMSFFVKACVVALREFPAINGEIAGDDIIYKNHYDIGVAVGTPQGLVVPVIR